MHTTTIAMHDEYGSGKPRLSVLMHGHGYHIGSMRDLKKAMRIAWRAARVEAQINYAPSHIEPDDPETYPGGRYYNTATMHDRYQRLVCATWQQVGSLDLIAQSLLHERARKDLGMAARLSAHHTAKMWAALVAEA
jgi:hypothetical protein